MTGPSDDPLSHLVAALELPEHGTGVRSARRASRGPSRRWMAVFSSCMVVAVGASLVLTYVGLQTVRTSKAGRIVSTVTDPTAPGFEAFVTPTPTLAVLHEVNGNLDSVAVVALNNGDAGGSVMLVPGATLAGSGADERPLSVSYAYGEAPAAGVRVGVQGLLGMGISEAVVVDDARWAELVGPVAPLTLENPDALEGFPIGPVSLSPEQVGPWLAAGNEGESDLARMYRQQLFWEAWAAAIAADPDRPDVVPGEVDGGIGRFARGLGNGPARVVTLPLVETVDAYGFPVLRADRATVDEMIAGLVPFPTGDVEGARTRVRLLNGSTDADHVARSAPLVVPANAEIVIAGNADRFSYTVTEIRYHGPGMKVAAERIRDSLGAGVVVDDPRPTDAFDVTVVLGSDT
ncbi:MAG: LytR family transcriptional regulator [Acidimicrobiia bacterium]|nr:LytR family transcriptional regulator [Acidimicrobiia bacterium]